MLSRQVYVAVVFQGLGADKSIESDREVWSKAGELGLLRAQLIMTYTKERKASANCMKFVHAL